LGHHTTRPCDDTGEMSEGRVTAIQIGPEASRSMRPVPEVVAVAGRGLEGDRYFQPGENGDPTAEITLIESEAIEAAAAESGVDIRLEDTRRNIITSGVRLATLLGKRFWVGEVEVEALEPNPPCRHLERLAGKPLLKPLAYRGGLRGRIVTGGRIAAGDPIGKRE
jgi:MOSC domain-containing protein YiiM